MLQWTKGLLLVVGLVGSVGASEVHWSESAAGRMLQELAAVRMAGVADFSRAVGQKKALLSLLRNDAVREAFVPDAEDDLAVEALRGSICKNIDGLSSGLEWLNCIDKDSGLVQGVLINIKQDSPLLYWYLRLINDFGCEVFARTKAEAVSAVMVDQKALEIVGYRADYNHRTEVISLDECVLIAILRLLGVVSITDSSGRSLVLRENELVAADRPASSRDRVRRELF